MTDLVSTAQTLATQARSALETAAARHRVWICSLHQHGLPAEEPADDAEHAEAGPSPRPWVCLDEAQPDAVRNLFEEAKLEQLVAALSRVALSKDQAAAARRTAVELLCACAEVQRLSRRKKATYAFDHNKAVRALCTVYHLSFAYAL